MGKSLLSAFVLLLLTLPASAQTSLPAAGELTSGWNAVATGGLCSTGTPFQFYARNSGDSDKLLIYFNGGGACWFGQACDLNSQPNVHTPFADADSNNRPGETAFLPWIVLTTPCGISTW